MLLNLLHLIPCFRSMVCLVSIMDMLWHAKFVNHLGAQFGDFSNGAQIMLDQFISAAEDKWKMMNGLVMLLPHGYEGKVLNTQAQEWNVTYSMCAQNNMQMVNCTTPANFFHVLRRQLMRNFRKPLVVFTPKSLLRHPLCVSSIQDLTTGNFKKLLMIR